MTSLPFLTLAFVFHLNPPAVVESEQTQTPEHSVDPVDFSSPDVSSSGNASTVSSTATKSVEVQQSLAVDQVEVDEQPVKAQVQPSSEVASKAADASSCSGQCSLDSKPGTCHQCPFKRTKNAKVEFQPGAQVFLRGWGRLNPDFDSSDKDHLSGVHQRIRVNLRATYGILSAFAEVQDARLWGFEQSTVSNEGNTDLHQGYLRLAWGDAGGDRYDIRVGRQEILWGSRRLIAQSPWNPNGRSFDATRVSIKSKKIEFDAFAAILDPVSSFTFVDSTQDPPTTESIYSRGTQLYGGRVVFPIHPAFHVDLHSLGIVQDVTESQPNFERKINNTGGRLTGKPTQWLSYEFEGHYQTGKVNRRDHQAWAAATDLRFQAARSQGKPTLKLAYSIASGEACNGTPDEGCGAAKSTEFFDFFGARHAYQGVVDLFGWRNIRDAEVGGLFQPIDDLNLILNYHYFQLQESTGRWSNIGGNNVGAGWDPTNNNHDLGHEIDLVANYKPWRVINLQPGYGLFIPTGAGKKLAGDDPQHFLYLWMMANF